MKKRRNSVQSVVPALTVTDRSGERSCEPAVPAEVPMAELRVEVERRIAEARFSKQMDFVVNGGRQYREDQAVESALVDLLKWLDRPRVAIGTGGNESRSTDRGQSAD